MRKFVSPRPRTIPGIALGAMLLLISSASAHARSRPGEHVSVGNDITISEGETASDIACAFCSVHIHGDVHGDVAVAFGSVDVDTGRTISGDVAVLAGEVVLADESHVGGDVAIAGGNLNLAPSASVRGDRAIFPGHFVLLLVLIPLLIPVGIIWLIVYLIRRNRYQFPAYPNGRRI